MSGNNKDIIDFVIPWVDGNDPEWIKEFNKYHTKQNNFTYRSWDNLKYWFRGVEKFTPWVNKIYFITWGHLPEWLDTEHPKLKIVKHSEYIDKECLPTFSSHPIEINMHRIKNLSEKFVYFNDDTFITSRIEPSRFFKHNLPCDCAVETILSTNDLSHIKLNNSIEINKHFIKQKQLIKNLSKWINYKYRIEYILRNLWLIPYPRYSSFLNFHMPQSYLKSSFTEVWDHCEDVMKTTSRSKFRDISDVNQYLIRNWQIVSGNFHPISMKDTINISVFDGNNPISKNKIEDACRAITSNKYNMICLNDGYCSEELFNKAQININKAFDSILEYKSKFEK